MLLPSWAIRALDLGRGGGAVLATSLVLQLAVLRADGLGVVPAVFALGRGMGTDVWLLSARLLAGGGSAGAPRLLAATPESVTWRILEGLALSAAPGVAATLRPFGWRLPAALARVVVRDGYIKPYVVDGGLLRRLAVERGRSISCVGPEALPVRNLLIPVAL